MPTKSKELIDFDLFEYREHARSGDYTYISEQSKKYGLNNGEGYSQPYVYSVVNEKARSNNIKFENTDIINLFKGAIRARLINEYYEEQSRKNTEEIPNPFEGKDWEKIVVFHRNKKGS